MASKLQNLNFHQNNISFKTSIPIDVCKYVLRHRLVNQFRTYLMLKSMCDSKLKHDHERLSKELAISSKTLSKHLKELIKLNWIGFDSKSKMLFIRGFDRIRLTYKFKSRTAIVCTKNDFKHLSAFLFGAAISNILRAKKREIWRIAATKPGVAFASIRHPFYFEVANSYMAKVVDYSIEGSMKLKAKAEKAGYISTKENIEARSQDLLNIIYHKKNPYGNLIVRCRSGIGFQRPDFISSNMKFSRRKKITTLNNLDLV